MSATLASPAAYVPNKQRMVGKFVVSADSRVYANHGIDLGGAVIRAGAAPPLTGTSADSLDGTSWNDFQARVGRIVAAQQGRRK